jgi:maltose alpha-D-glucosyltransferase/alpha-amylase
VFGQNYFPPIKETPYILTLGPHSHFWFVLSPQPESATRTEDREVPTIRMQPSLTTLLNGEQRKVIEREVLPSYVRNRRWFGSKARSMSGIRVAEQLAVSSEPDAARIWFIEVTYRDGAPETYTLPVQITRGDAARGSRRGRAARRHRTLRWSGGDDPAGRSLGSWVSRESLPPHGWPGASAR